MSEEFISFGIVSTLIVALTTIKIAYQEKQREKNLKKIPIKIRRR